MKQNTQRLMMVLCFLPLSGVAMAHTGGHESSGFLAGLGHPLAGLDHLAVMLAVGLWASVVMRRQAWQPVAAFLGFMVLGAVVGMSGFALTGFETGIAASVLVMGLLLVGMARVPAVMGVALIALFATFHGNAHGLEMPAFATPLLYSTGFLLTTGLLHLFGLKLGDLVTHLRSEWILRGMGVAVSGAGAWLLSGA